MGLDQYAFTAAKEVADGKDTDFEYCDEQGDYKRSVVKIAQWRKFNHLEGFMAKLYADKGGEKDSFNCACVRLDMKDLTELTAQLDTGKLQPTEGFFFGEPDLYPEDVVSLKKFIDEAAAALNDGKIVFYRSWW